MYLEWAWRALISLYLVCLSLQIFELKEQLSEISKLRNTYYVQAHYVLVNPCDLWDAAVKRQIESHLK